MFSPCTVTDTTSKGDYQSKIQTHVPAPQMDWERECQPAGALLHGKSAQMRARRPRSAANSDLRSGTGHRLWREIEGRRAVLAPTSRRRYLHALAAITLTFTLPLEDGSPPKCSTIMNTITRRPFYAFAFAAFPGLRLLARQAAPPAPQKLQTAPPPGGHHTPVQASRPAAIEGDEPDLDRFSMARPSTAGKATLPTGASRTAP